VSDHPALEPRESNIGERERQQAVQRGRARRVLRS